MAYKKDLSGIDFLKFIMAIFVVAIHTVPFKNVSNILFLSIWDNLVSIAVPFFFIASGYFLFLKLNNSERFSLKYDEIKKYRNRIIELYLYWTVIYLPIILYFILTSEKSLVMEIALFFRRFFFIGDHHYAWHLWYLLCMIYSLLIIQYLLLKKFKIKGVFFVSAMVFIFSILINFLIKNDFNSDVLTSTGNMLKYLFRSGRLFSGMLYMVIGGLIASEKIKPNSLKIILILGVGILFQVFYITIISEIAFVFIPTAIYLISFKIKLNNYINGYFFRKCSTIIYFSHMIFFFIFSMLFKDKVHFNILAFFFCTLLPIIITPLVLKYYNKSGFIKKVF